MAGIVEGISRDSIASGLIVTSCRFSNATMKSMCFFGTVTVKSATEVFSDVSA